MAAGTFVYVGATEVVADEFESPHHKWKKFGALLGGVVLIGYITHVAESFEHAAHHH
jgi:solute carrier family 39 (zinc transporter), member 1/2/3